ncbi:MAG: protein kinase [Planctomycetes bacterium]|nr:protein kinase [Planctomycetota bacterium]
MDLESLVAIALERIDEVGPSAIEQICAEHPGLADELRRKVAVLGAWGLDVNDVSPEPPNATPRAVGAYELDRLLGRGGMGEVWHARRTDIDQEVAIKFVRTGVALDEALRRFELERRAIARMQHDGIAKVFDVGSQDGIPYLAMEYVDGIPITEYCDAHDLGLRERIELFLQVCDAVQHAHQKGVIHRDLKPTNILVVDGEPRPVAKVIDFGLSKAIEASLDVGAQHTLVGQVVGTPQYMSPEQADAGHDDLDVRTDVYSLGVVLYELLTHAHPIDLPDVRSSGLARLLEAIATHEAKRPSSRVGEHVGEQTSKNQRLCRQLRGDLDCILLHALEHDRTRRYASVSSLSEDLGRYLAHEPIVARAPSVFYRLAKFARRNPTLTVGSLISTVAFVAIVTMVLRNATNSAEQLARFHELGDVVVLRKLEARAGDLLRVGAGEVPPAMELESWLASASDLIARRPDKQRLLAEIATADRDPSNEDIVLRDSIDELLRDLDEFEADGSTVDRVRRVLAWSHDVHRVTVGEAGERWRTAIESIASEVECPAYRGLRIEPQPGLVPLRRNPSTGLWEFRVWQVGGVEAEFDEHGRVPNMHVADPVVVLVPGGEAMIGAQYSDARRPHFDASALENQVPPHSVRLDPFFVGKHEITQAQWRRWAGSDPSYYDPARLHALALELARNSTPTAAYARADSGWPVDTVSRNIAARAVRAYGLDLPTEAQWEYAARAGTSTPWWSGRSVDDLVLSNGHAAANIADACAEETGAAPSDICIDERDGWPLAARVDALRPNRFGLHHVLGNVWEWCRDPYCSAYPTDAA